MATGLDTNTAARLLINPALVMVADRSVGPTTGGVTITTAVDLVQPEMDGVNQAIVGLAYKRSTTATVEFSCKEWSSANLQLANHNIAGSGTTPNFTFTPYANMTMLTASQYMASPGLKIFVPFTDGVTPGYWTFQMPNGLVMATFDGFGPSGEPMLKYTITSAVSASTPDAVPYTFGRVATLPTEVGGP